MSTQVMASELQIGDRVIFTDERSLFCRGSRRMLFEAGTIAEVVGIEGRTIDILFDNGGTAYGCSTDSMDKYVDDKEYAPDTKEWGVRRLEP